MARDARRRAATPARAAACVRRRRRPGRRLEVRLRRLTRPGTRATSTCHRARVSADGARTDRWSPCRWPGRSARWRRSPSIGSPYSPSPPVVFAVVDFDGGGRLPVELCDVDADEVTIGMRVEMTFRRLHTADGIHNYFWKARPHGQSRDLRPGRHRRDGLHTVRRALGQGARRPGHRRRRASATPAPASTRPTSTPTGSAPPRAG